MLLFLSSIFNVTAYVAGKNKLQSNNIINILFDLLLFLFLIKNVQTTCGCTAAEV